MAGLIALLGLLVGLADPAYYEPETALDYVAATLNTAGPVATSATLLIWWRVVPIRRGAFLILFAATSALVFGLGNFLEDIAGLDWGGDLFFFGGVALLASSAAAGVVALTVRNRWRWSGLILLAIAAGIGLDSAVVWVIAWLAFAVLLWKGSLGSHSSPRIPPDASEAIAG
jgi:hypothetical protein